MATIEETKEKLKQWKWQQPIWNVATPKKSKSLNVAISTVASIATRIKPQYMV